MTNLEINSPTGEEQPFDTSEIPHDEGNELATRRVEEIIVKAVFKEPFKSDTNKLVSWFINIPDADGLLVEKTQKVILKGRLFKWQANYREKKKQ